ncbi:MAG: hypothetical protein JWQ35_489 [Bacteriovoracaceae bacterium]|nr:hypothetical protein [Bacteriovoracaceae bacterium]
MKTSVTKNEILETFEEMTSIKKLGSLYYELVGQAPIVPLFRDRHPKLPLKKIFEIGIWNRMFLWKFKTCFQTPLLSLVLAAGSLSASSSLQAAQSNWCQRTLTKLTSSSVVQRIHSIRIRFKDHIDQNQKETIAELKERGLKIRPILYLRTLAESSAIFWLTVYGMEGMKLLDTASGHNLFGGNAHGSEITNHIVRNPAFMVFVLSGFAPLTEEFSFRLIPRTLFGKSWRVGVASSLIFGFAHNIHQIPLPQIIGGFYFWYLLKNRGLTHSILAHSITGTWVIIGTLYL